ncbi:receptor-like protein EIX2 [Cicer arietinum]|uniref:Receptor-like protein EIX2 n=1 Tax=Cicer arietinum TaxID=3827 RepID=A0A1S2YMZ3_CICAR|nr:receptor-like protein EIX2 [Cicer arietinum]
MPRRVLHFLICVVEILCINLLCAQSFHMNNCVEKERKALLKFKEALILERDKLNSWKGEECCKWEGISCDNLTHHVTNLDLNAKIFGGKLDSSICELQHLTSLNLCYNNLEGKIPKCIGSLGELIELDLSGNNLNSVIPPSLSNLSNLQTLNLGYNDHMIAYDLEWLSHLSNLSYLDLSNVNLTLVIDWLSSINKIPSLTELYLSGCGLHQVTPKSIPQLNISISLKSLNLGHNSLTSSILPWVINVSKVLTHLDLSSNFLQQSIPYDFENMIFLQYLDLSYNELQGRIPNYFRNMCQLQELYLNTNKLSGQFSYNIQQLCCAQNGLVVLDLSNNSFNEGTIPDFSCFSSLKELYLGSLNIFGTLPKSLIHLHSLVSLYLVDNKLNGVDIIDDGSLSIISILDLSFNQLNGSLPLFEITKLKSLETLDLSHNQLSGSFSQTIGHLSNLMALDLSSNKLNGVINEAILSNLSKLTLLDVTQNSISFNLSSDWVPPFELNTLHASSCTLGPKFPIWLKHFEDLEDLDISYSGISDSFPEWFWNRSSSLLYLNVSHNKINGALPKSFPSINNRFAWERVWDFRFNDLNGSLPRFPELRALFLSNNMFTGSLSLFCTSSFQSLTFLDLSSNLLGGKLSDCWKNFESLKVLNLAKNNLSGKIPNSFGTLEQIESIHLNNNKFCGEIPPLTLCSNLRLIDFGDNSLQGTIPLWIGHYLPQLTVLRVRGNKFQGNIPASLCNLSFLQVLDLSKNNITGEIPQCFSNIVALTNLKFPRNNFHYFSYISFFIEHEEYEFGSFYDKEILALKGSNREYEKNLGLMTSIDLSCNHLTGEIPQSITKLVALVGLNLSWNNLTGLIPSNIGHMKMLESLDLSRNHLYGRMPTSFSNLTFLSSMNLSFNNLEGKIPQSTQLESFDSSTYLGNSGLCGSPLGNHCLGDMISPKHVTNEDEDEDKLITFGFYISLWLGFFVGFWGVCGTLVIKTSWRHVYFQFFNNMSDWIHVTLVVFVIRMKKVFQVQDNNS